MQMMLLIWLRLLWNFKELKKLFGKLFHFICGASLLLTRGFWLRKRRQALDYLLAVTAEEEAVERDRTHLFQSLATVVSVIC